MAAPSSPPGKPAARLRLLRCAAALVLGGAAVSAWGQQAQAPLRAGIGLGTSDNVNRASAPEARIDETIRLVNLGVAADKTTARTQTNFNGDFVHYDYADNTYDAETTGGAVLVSTAQLVPERFSWQVTDNWGSQSINPLQNVTPNNRENVNIFRTGPDVSFGAGGRNSVDLQARGTWADFQRTNADNNRFDRSLAWTRQISSRLSMSLGIGRETTEFDDTTIGRYDTDRATFTSNLTGRRSNLSITVGKNDLESDRVSDDGTLFDLNFGRQLGANGRLNFRAARNFSAAGDIFRLSQAVGTDIGRTQQLLAAADPFESKNLALGFSTAGTLTSWEVRVFHFDDNYLTRNEFDRKYTGVDLGLERLLFRRWALLFDARVINEKFAVQEDTDGEWRIEFARRIGRTLRLGLMTEYRSRSVVDGLDNDEQRYFVTFSYARAPAEREPATLLETLQPTY